MQIENPFENGHIKNYLLLYASIVVIMVLFFIASTLFNDISVQETKVFNTKISQETLQKKQTKREEPSLKFKLLKSAY